MSKLSNDNQEAQTLDAEASGAHALLRRATVGASVFGARHVAVFGLNTLTAIAIAALVGPADFGYYQILSVLVSGLGPLATRGLAGNLVRDRSEPGPALLSAMFTFQVAVALILAVLVLGTLLILGWLHIHVEAEFLLVAFALGLIAAAVQSIPQVMLERRMAFGAMATIDVAQSVVFNATLLAAAIAHHVELLFALALLSRLVVGGSLAFRFAEWRPRWHLDLAEVRGHLTFGLAQQGSWVLRFARDSFPSFVIGGLFGLKALGELHWASTIVGFPVLLLVAVNRVTLPLFAHAESAGRDVYAQTVRRVALVVCGGVAMATGSILVSANSLILPVFGLRWQPAVALFLGFAFANLIMAPTTIATTILEAGGQATAVTKLNLVWLIIMWGLGTLAVMNWGWMIMDVVIGVMNIPNLYWIYVAGERVGFSLLTVLFTTGSFILIPILSFALFAHFAEPTVASVAAIVTTMILGLVSIVWLVRGSEMHGHAG